MPTRKIHDFSPSHSSCNHPEHNPPSMIVLPPGLYEHTCPRCGQKQTFTVKREGQLQQQLQDQSNNLWWNCDHEWEEKTDSQFSNELFTDVICTECGCPGEKHNKTKEVFYPAT